VHFSKSGPLMSELGQTRSFDHLRRMSGLPAMRLFMRAGLNAPHEGSRSPAPARTMAARRHLVGRSLRGAASADVAAAALQEQCAQ
jgi:hypothetical protein